MENNVLKIYQKSEYRKAVKSKMASKMAVSRPIVDEPEPVPAVESWRPHGAGPDLTGEGPGAQP